MKKLTVVMLAVVSLTFAGFAEAAKPRKRSRNSDRIGAYGGVLIGQTNYTSTHSIGAQTLIATLDALTNGAPHQNDTFSTEDTDQGYQAMMGYRFTRYIAAELSLAQYGSYSAILQSDVDFGPPNGVLPTRLRARFSAGGPVLSLIGVLPINEKIELFGRAGYLFASTKTELQGSVDGDRSNFGGPRADSQNVVLGLGLSWNFNQVYAARFEYQRIDGVGKEASGGEEDLNVMGIGVIIRF
jgi:opacity protein-like surface antigen